MSGFAITLFSSCVPVALLGCETEQKVGPSAANPGAIVRSGWYGRTPTTQEVRGPLTVDRAIEEALAASRTLEQIYQRIDAAAAQIQQVEAAFYPRLILSQGFSATDNPVYALMYIFNQKRGSQNMNFNSPGQQENNVSRIEAQWLLFEGGTRVQNRRAAQQERQSVRMNLLAARNELTGAVTESYYRWLQSLDFVSVAERAVTVAQADEKLAEDRLEAQMLLRSELLRLRTNRSEADGNLVTARNNARRLRAALERLLVRQIEPSEVPKMSAPPKGPEPPSAETRTLVEQALAQRAEIAAAEALISAARARVKAAEGELLPQVAANADYEWNSRDLREPKGSWMAGVQATWNIFEGGLTRSRIREAQARLREMTLSGEQIALDIALEVHQAATGVQDAVARINVAAEQKKWAEQGLEETQQLYRNQVVTVDALLQAELAWNRAEVTYSAAAFDGKIAEAMLRKAMGDFADRMMGKPK
jgi:outer membrane protein